MTDARTYPRRLYDIIYAYHKAGGGQFEHALDVGCGPGFMALELASRFTNVTGIDPEDSMVAAGLQPESGNGIRYAKGTAEDLPAVGLGENSIDLAVAGEAAHYFTHENSWPQLARALKPKGSVAWIVSG